MTCGKVAVLIGGPDWPTSVTCGILKVPIVPMLLGTCPVVFIMAPCVLAGAYLAKAEPGVESTDSTLANIFIMLAGAGQLLSMIWATNSIKAVYTSDDSLNLEPTDPDELQSYNAVKQLRHVEKRR